jgi:hypothetical protein
MTIGIKISQPGFDVKTCEDKDLVMSSEFNMLKTKMTGITSGDIAHGLSYIPIYFAMNKISDTKWGIVGQNYFAGIPYIDITNFYSQCSPSEEVVYYIFYQQGI